MLRNRRSPFYGFLPLLLALTGLLLLCPDGREAATHGRWPAAVFEVITFNSQFLPGPGRLLNRRPAAEYRATVLAERLQFFEVIGLNEVFDEDCRSLLLDKLEQVMGPEMRVVTSPAEDVSPLGIGSGLLLVTRFHVTGTHTLKFGNDSRPLTHGVLADGYAAKGALHARVRFERAGPVDVFVTHLESRDPEVRTAQVSLLADFIREHTGPERPFLLLGDLNIPGGAREQHTKSTAYRGMLQRLRAAYPHGTMVDLGAGMHKGEAGTSDADRADGGERIDYIFLANPADANRRLTPRAVAVERFEDVRVKSLSDHLAVTAELVAGAREHGNQQRQALQGRRSKRPGSRAGRSPVQGRPRISHARRGA